MVRGRYTPMRFARPFLSLFVALFVLLVAQAAHAQQFCYAYDELNRLVAVVDLQGHTVLYTYDAVGNILATQRNDATSPVAITFVNPSEAVARAQIQILGTGFSANPTENQVTFQGVAARVLEATPCMLIVEVPDGAPTGDGSLVVTTPNGTATASQPFTVVGGVFVTPPQATIVIRQGFGFVATVTGLADQRVIWSVNGIVGGDATVGTISATGVYTAPATVPTLPTVTVEATSVPVPGAMGQATVTIVKEGNNFAAAVPVAYLNTFIANLQGDGYADIDKIRLGLDPTQPNSRPPTLAEAAPVAYLNTFIANLQGDGYADIDKIRLGLDPTQPNSRPPSLALSPVVSYQSHSP